MQLPTIKLADVGIEPGSIVISEICNLNKNHATSLLYKLKYCLDCLRFYCFFLNGNVYQLLFKRKIKKIKFIEFGLQNKFVELISIYKMLNLLSL